MSWWFQLTYTTVYSDLGVASIGNFSALKSNSWYFPADAAHLPY